MGTDVCLESKGKRIKELEDIIGGLKCEMGDRIGKIEDLEREMEFRIEEVEDLQNEIDDLKEEMYIIEEKLENL